MLADGPVVHGTVVKIKLFTGVHEVVGMDDEAVILKKHNCVSRWLKASFQSLCGLEIQPHLVIHRTQAGERYAQPMAGQWPVNMAEEKVLDLSGVRIDDALEFFLLSQRNSIQCWNSDVERRVMHKQVDAAIAGLGQLSLKPGESPIAVPAVMVAGLMGIQEQETTRRVIEHRLNEAIIVEGLIWKPSDEFIARIVVAEQEFQWKFEFIQALLQVLERFWFTPVGKITGEYAQLGIGMVVVYICDAPNEITLWVTTIEGFTFRDEMGVGKVNQFHVSDAGQAKLDPCSDPGSGVPSTV